MKGIEKDLNIEGKERKERKERRWNLSRVYDNNRKKYDKNYWKEQTNREKKKRS